MKELMRFIVAIIICILIMCVFIYYNPLGIEREIQIKWIIEYLPLVWFSFFNVSIGLIFLGLFFSLGLVWIATKMPLVRIVFIILSSLPIFAAGIWIIRIIPCYESMILLTIAGLILGLCDAFFIELYRYCEIEINAVKNESYFLMAYANGLKGFKLFWYMKNDFIIHLLKLVTSKLIFLISSAVIVEWIFNLKGIGNLIITAAEQKDIELLIATEIFIVVFVILCSFVNRIADGILDPRLREE